MNSRGVVEGEMGAILKGPHIKRLLVCADSPPVVEIEPLRFHPIYEDRHSHQWRVRRWAA